MHAIDTFHRTSRDDIRDSTVLEFDVHHADVVYVIVLNMRHTTARGNTMDGLPIATDEKPCQIEDVCCLFNVLPAGFCADAPPRCTGHPTHPISECTENLRLLFKHRFGILRITTVTPVITHTRDYAALFNVFIDDNRRFQLGMDRLLDKHRDALFASDAFLFTVGKGGCADINRVQVLFVVHGAIVGVSVSAKFFGTLFCSIFRDVTHCTKFNVFKAVFEVAHVCACHTAGSDKTEFHFIHIFSLKWVITENP